MASLNRRVAVLMDAIEDDYQAAIVRGITRTNARAHVQLLCLAGGVVGGPLADHRSQRNFLFDIIDPQALDGVISLSAALGNHLGVDGFTRWLKRFARVPLVSLGTELPGLHSISVDNRAGMRALVLHLVTIHRRRRVAFIRGPTTSHEAEERYLSYRAALEESGIEVDERLVLEGDWLRESGMRAVRGLMERRGLRIETIDAIASANDYMALGALDELNAHGIAVPEAVALAGFDDLDALRGVVPTLTTVRQPTEELGASGLQSLLALMNDGEKPISQTLAAQLVVRRSCGCLQHDTTYDRKPVAAHGRGFEANLIENRALICAELSRSARGALFSAGSGWEDRLFAAFLSDVVGEEPRVFVDALAKIALKLRRSAAENGMLETVLKTMRRRVLDCAGSDANALARAAETLDEARDTLADFMQRDEVCQKINALHQVREFSALVALLLRAPSIETLQAAFADRLGALGIGAFSLGLFTEPDRVTESCVCLAAFSDTKRLVPPKVFRTRDLAPPELLVGDTRPVLVQPLVFNGAPIGVVTSTLGVMETNVYEQLRESMSAGLQGYRLARGDGQ